MKTFVTSAFLICLSFSLIGQSTSDYTIHLRNFNLNPEENTSAINVASYQENLFDNSFYVMIQFKEIPDADKIHAMEQQGIRLFGYIPVNTYLAEIKGDFLNTNWSVWGIRTIQEVKPEYKIDALLSGNPPDYSVIEPGSMDLIVLKFPTIRMKKVIQEIEKHGFKLMEASDDLSVLHLRIPESELMDLASMAWCYWISPLSMPLVHENNRSKTFIRSNVLGSKELNGRNLTGKDIGIGIWDAGKVQEHIDIKHRLTVKENVKEHNHATHVSGTMSGAGILDPMYEGMAPESKIYSWYFDGWIPYEMDSAVKYDSIVITQNSYAANSNYDTCYKRGYYDIYSYLLDDLVIRHPNLIHVYAAGNYQSQCYSGGYRTISSGSQCSKNIIVVGGVDNYDEMYAASSWGPTRNGRIKPEICAVAKTIISTINYDEYGAKSGTSMACPAVSGLIAQLYQRYRELYGKEPDASLIKAILCNTALDKGNYGPDYQFGFGIVDGLRAVESLENHWYDFDSLGHNDYYYDTVYVNSNTLELKVLLTWSDVAADPYSQVDSISLINDLDLTVSSISGNTFYPMVLDSANPSLKAVPGMDSINNIEQVVIDMPTSGYYVIKVSGKRIVNGKQSFTVTHDQIKKQLRIVYPNGGEGLLPETGELIRWDAFGISGNLTLEFSADNGKSWDTIVSDYAASNRYYTWLTPDTFSSECLIRIISSSLSDTSDATFSIMEPPSSLYHMACNQQLHLYWNSVQEAPAYDVFILDTLGKWIKKARVEDSFYTFKSLNNNESYWLTVASADDNGVTGRKSRAIVASPDAAIYPPEIETDIFSDTLCVGDFKTFSVKIKGHDSIGYQWQKSIDQGKTWNILANEKDSFLNVTAKASDHLSQYRVLFYNQCLSLISSNTASLYLDTAIHILTNPPDVISCIGDSVVFKVHAQSLTPMLYQWEMSHDTLNWTAISGETDTLIELKPLQYSWDSTYYRLKITNLCVDTVSNMSTLRVHPPLQLNILKDYDTICYGKNIELEAKAEGGDATAYQFEWENGWGTNPKINPVLTADSTFKVSVYDNCSPKPLEDSVMIRVRPGLGIDIFQEDTLICKGNTIPLSTWATGGISKNYRYEWTPASDTMQSIFVNPETTVTYKVRLFDDCSAQDAFDSVLVKVREALSVKIVPDKDSFCNGNKVSLSAMAKGGYVPGYQYYWFFGFGSDSVVTDTPQATTYYKIKLEDDCTTEPAYDSIYIYLREVNADWTYQVDFLNLYLQAQYVNAKMYDWNFGDGNTSTQANPTHSYSQPGNYKICLEVTDWSDCKSALCRNLSFIENSIEENDHSFSVYPNPSQGVLFIEMAGLNTHECYINLYNALGEKTDYNFRKISNTKIRIDLNNNSKGVYLLYIQQGETKYQKLFLLK